MTIKDTIKIGQPVQLEFKLYNGTDTTAKFLKWQTPFEPLLSKYLDIKDEQGNEVPYIGAMAKRIMPPPADAYLKVSPKDSLSAKVDILKGYALEKTGKYTVTFSSSEMSGITVGSPVTFNYVSR
ncbi:protease [Mucilaginibacter antarcticus]